MVPLILNTVIQKKSLPLMGEGLHTDFLRHQLFAQVVPFQSRGIQLKGFENRQFSVGTYNRKTAEVKPQNTAEKNC